MARLNLSARVSAIVISGLALSMVSLSASAGSKYPPSDPDCRKWEKRTVTGNWVNAPNGDYWVCVQGPRSGTRVSVSESRQGGDDGHDDGNGSCKPGWGKGDANHEHCGPPGQMKKK